MMYKVKHGALTICMENPEIPGRIQLERFIPVEIFRKKRYTFQDITYLFPVFTETTEIFCTYHLLGLLVPGFMSRESENFSGIC